MLSSWFPSQYRTAKKRIARSGSCRAMILHWMLGVRSDMACSRIDAADREPGRYPRTSASVFTSTGGSIGFSTNPSGARSLNISW